MAVGLILALSTLLAASAPANAQMRVMCYGDSITAGSDETNPANSYPGELQQLRPDLEVVNEGRDGDVSGNLARFEAALKDWPPDVVVLMLGTDDAVCARNGTPGCKEATTPDEAAANVLRMAAAARNAGVKKIFVLTPPPAVCKANCDSQNEVAYAMWVRDAFTARLSDVLRQAHMTRGIRVADLRHRLSDGAWSTLSSDGVRPSSEGNRMLARFIAAYIPKGEVREASTGRRRHAYAGHASTRRHARHHVHAEPGPFARRPTDPRYTY